MNKKVKLIFMTFLTICSCVVPFFNVAKAETLTPGRTSQYGSYSAETYYINTNTPLQSYDINLYVVTLHIEGANSSVFHLHYDFNNTYTGVMVVTVQTNVSFTLNNCEFAVDGGYFQVIPNISTSSTSKTFYIGLKDTDTLDFYLTNIGYNLNTALFGTSVTFTVEYPLMELSTSNNALLNEINAEAETINSTLGQIYDYMIGGMTMTLSSILSAIREKADYQIMNESLLAYYFALNGEQVLMSDGDISTKAEISNGAYTRPLAFEPNKTYYFYFYSSVNAVQLTPVNNRVTTTVETIPPTMSGYRLIKYTMVNETENTVTERFQWGQAITIVPLYLGDGYGMSQEMQSITKHRSSNLTTDLLQQILDFLNGNVTEEDTSFFDNAMDQITNFYNSLLTTLPSNQDVQNSVNDTPEIVGPLSTFEFNSITGFVDSYYNDLTTIFPFIKLLVVAGMVTFVMKVML